MIQANELRIGNKVYGGDPARCIATIQTILQQGIEAEYQLIGYGAAANNPGLGFANLYDIYPIPLTPDILEKCGFEKRLEYWEPFVGDAKGAWYKRGDIFIVILKADHRVYRAVPTNGDEFGYVDGPELTSLHQLQNLIFALTCEEPEVKL